MAADIPITMIAGAIVRINTRPMTFPFGPMLFASCRSPAGPVAFSMSNGPNGWNRRNAHTLVTGKQGFVTVRLGDTERGDRPSQSPTDPARNERFTHICRALMCRAPAIEDDDAGPSG